MRILQAHTFYKQPGGEDRVFAAETAMLREHGHDVIEFRESNMELDRLSKLGMAAATIWNRAAYSRLRAVIRNEHPDICHFHNTFPAMSPAVFYAARSQGIPVVLTLHNYRLLCPSATLLREGHVCEDCLSRFFPWPAVAHACYRDHRPTSAVASLMLTIHRLLGTWTELVDIYITLTEFARRKFILGGLPAYKVVVKSNCVPDPGPGHGPRDGALFVGRLSPEKGVDTLLAAWRLLDAPIPLRIAGDGPLAPAVAEAAQSDPRIEWLGSVSAGRVRTLMLQSRFLVLPSVWYEGLPLTIIEAYAAALPVIASDLGSMAELVLDGETGIRFTPGAASDLSKQISWCWSHQDELKEMGRRARTRFEEKYTAAANYQQLMQVYRRAVCRTDVTVPAKPGQPTCSYMPGSH